MRLDREGVHRPRGRQRERDPAHGRAGRARRGGLDLVGREGGAGDLPGLEEVRGGDQHFVGARRPRDAAVPAELRLGGGASELLILHLEVIVVRGAQPDRRRERRGREVVVRLPAVDDERVVDPELHTVRSSSDPAVPLELVGGVARRCNEPRIPHRERLDRRDGVVVIPRGRRLELRVLQVGGALRVLDRRRKVVVVVVSGRDAPAHQQRRVQPRVARSVRRVLHRIRRIRVVHDDPVHRAPVDALLDRVGGVHAHGVDVPALPALVVVHVVGLDRELRRCARRRDRQPRPGGGRARAVCDVGHHDERERRLLRLRLVVELRGRHDLLRGRLRGPRELRKR
mmetsp:Transcript_18257/g.41053  ORF Transcript_18257/g.41053 Transcript_18257/m.41053 type:complete len:342 (+) Transcript_18257:7650-8675(+)